MTNYRNWKNADLKIGDVIDITVQAEVTRVDDSWLWVNYADDIEARFRPCDDVDFELLKRPSQWTDGDVVINPNINITWRRREGIWYNDMGGDPWINEVKDTEIEAYINKYKSMEVLRQQSKER